MPKNVKLQSGRGNDGAQITQREVMKFSPLKFNIGKTQLYVFNSWLLIAWGCLSTPKGKKKQKRNCRFTVQKSTSTQLLESMLDISWYAFVHRFLYEESSLVAVSEYSLCTWISLGLSSSRMIITNASRISSLPIFCHYLLQNGRINPPLFQVVQYGSP